MRKNRWVFTGRELIYIVTALLMYFQIYLQTVIGVMQYFDEFVTVVCLLKIVIVAFKGRLEKNHAIMLIIMGMVAGIGLISNFTANVQTELAPIITDIGNCFKVYVVYIGSTYFLRKIQNKTKIINTIASVMRCFVLLIFACAVLHELGIVEMGSDVRYGLKSFQFINAGAGQLSFMFYSLLFVLTLDMCNERKVKRKTVYIAIALVVWAATLRSRAFLYILIYIYLYWLLVMREKQFRLNISNSIVITGAGVFFCMDQFETYFLNTKTARYNLMAYGIETMKRYFPLGSGFATYGTDAAVKYYSKLYEEYGFGSIYGLSRSYSAFAHDTYWPAIVAQFGIFGVSLIVYLLYRLFSDVFRKIRNDKYKRCAAMFVLITQVTSSIATATFFHFVTVGLFFLVPLVFDEDADKRIVSRCSN